MNEEVLTVKEVAARFRVTGKCVCDLFGRGDLLGFRVGSEIRIYASSVDDYIARRSNAKRPKPEKTPINVRQPRRIVPPPGATGFRFIKDG